MSRQPNQANSHDVFETTMEHLEKALNVGHIATFGFITCEADENARQVMERYPDFDQIPVQRGGRVVGVLERGRTSRATAAEAMRPLDVSLLVAAEEPIARFIPCLLEDPCYRLVLQGQQLNGIVTRSDLLKLPVRLLAFARVTHLELVLANLISTYYPDDSWLALLSSRQRKALNDLHQRLSNDRIDPAWLELSGFEHKCTVVSNLSDLEGSFAADMAELKDLRDQLAHSKDFVANEAALVSFLTRLQLADRWIVELSTMLDYVAPESQKEPVAETKGSQ